MNQEIRQETNKPENSKKPEKDTALRDHIKARITRKPNRIIKRSFIESAMCNHNIVMLLMGMLVFLGILGICIMPKQEMPQFTIGQGACVAVYPGATSEEVEERVAKPLENFIFGYKEVNKKKDLYPEQGRHADRVPGTQRRRGGPGCLLEQVQAWPAGLQGLPFLRVFLPCRLWMTSPIPLPYSSRWKASRKPIGN